MHLDPPPCVSLTGLDTPLAMEVSFWNLRAMRDLPHPYGLYGSQIQSTT